MKALETLALENNPTLAQAHASVGAAQGRAIQAGLYPNPTVGYIGEQIGDAGDAGQQGAFVDQTIVTAGKLRLSRAKFNQEVMQTRWQVIAQQYRVINGVRMRYYQLLALQRLWAVRELLVQVAEGAALTTEALINGAPVGRPELLQARIEAREQRVGLQNLQARIEAAWRELTALVGRPDLPWTHLEGSLEEDCFVPDFEAAYAHLLEASPEVHIARAEVHRNRYALKRELVEPIPNVNIRGGTQYNFESSKQQALAQVYFKVPIFDRNQGNIRQARADLDRAAAEVGRVELSLRERLARAYAQYRTATAVAELYRKQNLPDAREAYELFVKSYRQRQTGWPQVLIAQRTYFRIAVEYLEALVGVRRAQVAIYGLLLVDGLEEPPGAPSQDLRRDSDRLDPMYRRVGNPLDPREGRGPDDRLGSRP